MFVFQVQILVRLMASLREQDQREEKEGQDQRL